MEYLALYRKYRPGNFEEVVGQNHITTSLKNAIKNEQISHAYLFCGTRGTGKTTIARIFAKAINCENPVNGSPCNKCKTCVALSEPSNLDIVEIDAASNNRVEEIRELREKVKYPPVNGKYKVYIIDEVHMLTDSAFNALLKTLEEPPKYVVFILGTTEVQKLPATILSRCLRFDFKLISNEQLENLVKKIFDDSKIKYEDAGVSLIAKLGEGSARDTLSIADMCVAFTNKNVTYKSVVEAVGTTDNSTLKTLAKYLLTKEVNGLLGEINTIANSGKNLSQLAKDLAGYFRDIAVVKTCKNYEEILKYPKSDMDELKEFANYDINRILQVLKTLGSLEQDFRYTQNPRALFEIVMLGLVTTDSSELLDKVAELEGKIKNMVLPQQRVENKTSVSSEKSAENNEVKSEKAIEVGGSKISLSNQEIFGKLLVNLRENSEFKLYVMLEKVNEYNLNGNDFIITLTNGKTFEDINKDKNLISLNKYIKLIDQNLKISFELNEKKEQEVDVTKLLENDFGKILKVNKGE